MAGIPKSPILTQKRGVGSAAATNASAFVAKESLRKCLPRNEIAGEEIRTPDVQLGKNATLFSEKLLKPLVPAV